MGIGERVVEGESSWSEDEGGRGGGLANSRHIRVTKRWPFSCSNVAAGAGDGITRWRTMELGETMEGRVVGWCGGRSLREEDIK